MMSIQVHQQIQQSPTSFSNSLLKLKHYFTELRMTSYETTLKDQLKDAGNNLLNLPSSLDELLNLLDKVETLLANVEQAPSK